MAVRSDDFERLKMARRPAPGRYTSWPEGRLVGDQSAPGASGLARRSRLWRPAAAGSPSDARNDRLRDGEEAVHPCDPPQAASVRAVEKRRCGFPPGGLRGPPSSSHRASRMASMLTGALSPSGARNAGQEAIAEASEAQDARMARFSGSVRDGCVTTSFGCSKTVPGWRSA